MTMSGWETTILAVLVVLGAYIVTRLASKAIFRSYFEEKERTSGKGKEDQENR